MATVYRTILSSPFGSLYGGQASSLTGQVIDSTGTAIPLYDSAGVSLGTTTFAHTEIGSNTGNYQATIYTNVTQAGIAVYTWAGTPSLSGLGTDVVAPPPSVDPTAVWNALTSTLTTAGSIGAYTLAQLGLIGSTPVVIQAGSLPVAVAYSIYRNTTVTLNMQAYNQAGTAYNLTGANLVFTAKTFVDDVVDDAGAAIKKTQALSQIVIDNAALGQFHLTILKTDTSNYTLFDVPGTLLYWSVKDLTAALIVAQGTLTITVPTTNEIV